MAYKEEVRVLAGHEIDRYIYTQSRDNWEAMRTGERMELNGKLHKTWKRP